VKQLLDTDVVVDALRLRAGVLARLAASSPDSYVVASVTVAELAYGALGGRDPALGELQWKTFVEPLEVLPFDTVAALEHARLRLALRARPIGERDLLIAAIAMANNLGVITRNVREFGRVPGLAVETW
jgi:tRNA(fMet)-specific endonuclease VapC